jgi:hypothetical protein
MGRNPKRTKYEGELRDTIEAIDKCEGRIIRHVNKLADLRKKRQRLKREIAKQMAVTVRPAT